MNIAQVDWPHFLGVHRNVIIVLVGILAALVSGTVIRGVAIRKAPADVAAKRLASLGTWWAIAVLFTTAVLLGRVGMVCFFCLVSCLSLREYMTLVRATDRGWLMPVWMLIGLLLNYFLIARGWVGAFVVLVPLLSLLWISSGMVLCERADGYLLTTSSLYWGMMLTVYCVSHAPLLLTLPAAANPVAGPAGWLLYLILLTELNDICQALIGRRIGKKAIAPILSPHKTWEGLLGGIAVTTIAAALLAPVLTPLADATLHLGQWQIHIPYLPACLAGLMIGIAGYFGDLNISGIKRDAGVKDSGHMLPGQGGILDRIDSLTFTAPLFYYFVRSSVVFSSGSGGIGP